MGLNPTEIWLWSPLWFGPSRKFTDIDLISVKSTPGAGFVDQQNVPNRQVAEPAPRTPLGQLTTALLRLLS